MDREYQIVLGCLITVSCSFVFWLVYMIVRSVQS